MIQLQIITYPSDLFTEKATGCGRWSYCAFRGKWNNEISNQQQSGAEF